MPAQVWHQLTTESREDYSRFLFYRNMGPGRTLRGAHRIYYKQIKGPDAVPAGPGQGWRSLYVDNRWKERAVAWDLHRLQVVGAEVSVLYIQTLKRMAKTAYKTALEAKPGSQEWRDLVQMIEKIGKRFDEISGKPRELGGPDDHDSGPESLPPAGPAALTGHDPDGAAEAAAGVEGNGRPVRVEEPDDGIT